MTRRPTGALALLVVSVALAGPRATPAAAQDPALDVIERMVAWGRADEARAALADWWSASHTGASRGDAQRALWLRARLTVDPAQASRDYRRLVVEYPAGAYTAMAIFRLAQGAHAVADGPTLERYMQTLRRDHPGSPVLGEAETWLRSAGAGMPVVTVDPAPGSTRDAPPATDAGVRETTVAEDVPAAAERPAQRAAPDSAVGPTPQATRPGRYTVQLGAFASRERADALYDRAREAGLEVRVVNVRGSNLFHVRVGIFDSSGEAGVFFQQVTERGFTAAVVRDADREEPARE